MIKKFAVILYLKSSILYLNLLFYILKFYLVQVHDEAMLQANALASSESAPLADSKQFPELSLLQISQAKEQETKRNAEWKQ